MQHTATLEITDLRVSYGSVNAVRGVDLVVGPGEVLGVLGANGAGKSSLVNAIMGAVPATGAIVFTRMLYLAPSICSVLVRPARPSLAAP